MIKSKSYLISTIMEFFRNQIVIHLTDREVVERLKLQIQEQKETKGK